VRMETRAAQTWGLIRAAKSEAADQATLDYIITTHESRRNTPSRD
jgi:hypothetical protein